MSDSKFKSKLKRLRDILAIASCSSGLAIVATYLGLFQNIEWLTLDLWFRMRPQEQRESRITVVTIGESDLRKLRQWPISDRVLSELITKISQQQPRAIGLDIYRDFPVEPGSQKLTSVFRSTPNLIGVEKAIGERIAPSPVLAQQQQTALSDLLIDSDGKIRRGLLSVRTKSGEVKLGLGAKLALMYLKQEGIELKPIEGSYQRSLGQATFIPFNGSDGGYVRADRGGFQILLNYRGREDSFNRVSILDVLNDDIPSDLLQDKLVLVGSIAPSLNDLFPTPYSEAESEYLPGVFIHANLASQILSEALDGRSSLKTVNNSLECLWILVWTTGGSIFTWKVLNRNALLKKDILSLIRTSTVCSILPVTILSGSSYLLFLSGWWIPAITTGFSLVFSTITVSSYYNQNQKKLVYLDGLTEIANRRYFDLFLEQHWLQREKKEQNIALILCDIDYFKNYNDTYGHQSGDMCLRQVAQTIHKSLRSHDLAARYGGEEFAIVLLNANAQAATIVAKRICARIRALEIPHEDSQVSDRVTISCGVVSTSMGTINSIENLIKTADVALYQAKAQGRDRPVLAQATINDTDN